MGRGDSMHMYHFRGIEPVTHQICMEMSPKTGCKAFLGTKSSRTATDVQVLSLAAANHLPPVYS